MSNPYKRPVFNLPCKFFSDRGSVKSPQRPLDQVSEPSLVSREERDIERILPSQLTLVLNRDPANIYKSERLG